MAEGGSLTTFESPLRQVHEREKDPGTAPNLLPSGRRAAGRVNDRAPSGESAAQQVKAIGERVMRIASKFTESMDKDHDRARATERESRKALDLLLNSLEKATERHQQTYQHVVEHMPRFTAVELMQTSHSAAFLRGVHDAVRETDALRGQLSSASSGLASELRGALERAKGVIVSLQDEIRQRDESLAALRDEAAQSTRKADAALEFASSVEHSSQEHLREKHKALETSMLERRAREDMGMEMERREKVLLERMEAVRADCDQRVAAAERVRESAEATMLATKRELLLYRMRFGAVSALASVRGGANLDLGSSDGSGGGGSDAKKLRQLRYEVEQLKMELAAQHAKRREAEAEAARARQDLRRAQLEAAGAGSSADNAAERRRGGVEQALVDATAHAEAAMAAAGGDAESWRIDSTGDLDDVPGALQCDSAIDALAGAARAGALAIGADGGGLMRTAQVVKSAWRNVAAEAERRGASRADHAAHAGAERQSRKATPAPSAASSAGWEAHAALVAALLRVIEAAGGSGDGEGSVTAACGAVEAASRWSPAQGEGAEGDTGGVPAADLADCLQRPAVALPTVTEEQRRGRGPAAAAAAGGGRHVVLALRTAVGVAATAVAVPAAHMTEREWLVREFGGPERLPSVAEAREAVAPGSGLKALRRVFSVRSVLSASGAAAAFSTPAPPEGSETAAEVEGDTSPPPKSLFRGTPQVDESVQAGSGDVRLTITLPGTDGTPGQSDSAAPPAAHGAAAAPLRGKLESALPGSPPRVGLVEGRRCGTPVELASTQSPEHFAREGEPGADTAPLRPLDDARDLHSALLAGARAKRKSTIGASRARAPPAFREYVAYLEGELVDAARQLEGAAGAKDAAAAGKAPSPGREGGVAHGGPPGAGQCAPRPLRQREAPWGADGRAEAAVASTEVLAPGFWGHLSATCRALREAVGTQGGHMAAADLRATVRELAAASVPALEAGRRQFGRVLRRWHAHCRDVGEPPEDVVARGVCPICRVSPEEAAEVRDTRRAAELAAALVAHLEGELAQARAALVERERAGRAALREDDEGGERAEAPSPAPVPRRSAARPSPVARRRTDVLQMSPLRELGRRGGGVAFAGKADRLTRSTPALPALTRPIQRTLPPEGVALRRWAGQRAADPLQAVRELVG